MVLGIKNRRKSAWEWARALDRMALPLIPEYGVTEAYVLAEEQLEGLEKAYQQAALELEMEGRVPYGRRLKDLAGEKGSASRDLASGRFEGSTCRAKC